MLRPLLYSHRIGAGNHGDVPPEEFEPVRKGFDPTAIAEPIYFSDDIRAD